MDKSCFWHYRNKYNCLKFKEGKNIQFILGLIENENSNLIYYKISHDASKLKINDINNLKYKTIEEFKLVINDSSLNYINIVPHVFKDIGRQFNIENNIISPKQQ